MKVELNEIVAQLYLLPTIKITYDKWLNGRYEFLIGWLKWDLCFSIGD